MTDTGFGNIALCILPQSAFGTINATIAALTDTANAANGLVVGVGDAGDAQSGITLPTFTRIGRDAARIGQSSQADTFIRVSPAGLKIKFPLGGARNTSSNPTVAADFNLATYWPGFDAILKASGCSGAADTLSHLYTATSDLTYASVGVWSGGYLDLFKDVVVSSLVFDSPPGDAGTVEASFSTPSLVSRVLQALTTITTGNQATAVPVVKGAGNALGATRPFESFTLTLTPTVEEAGDSNETSTGRRIRQTGFDVAGKAVMYAAASDPDFEMDALEASAPTGDMTFNIGSATGAAAVCKTYGVLLNNIVVRNTKKAKLGTYLGWESDFEGKAITTAGTEFTLKFF